MVSRYVTLGLVGLATVGMSITAPAAIIDTGSVVITFEDSTIFGTPTVSNLGSDVTFAWAVPTSIALGSVSSNKSKDFTLPDYSVTASTGFHLSGVVRGVVGDFNFSEIGASPPSVTVSAAVTGNLFLNNALLSPVELGLTRVERSSDGGFTNGYLRSESSPNFGNYTQFGLTNSKLHLEISVGEVDPGGASIFATSSTVYSATFHSTPVPVPAGLWLLTPALAALSTRRRAKA